MLYLESPLYSEVLECLWFLCFVFIAMTEVLSPHPQLRRILHKDHDEVVRNHALLSVKLTEMGELLR